VADLAGLGEGTRGVWTRKQALAVTTRGHVDALVRRREWQTLWPGVYADGGSEFDLEQRGFAAVLASGADLPATGSDGTPRQTAVIAGRLAARLYGYPLVDDADPATGRWEHLMDDVAVDRDTAPLLCTRPDGQVRVLIRHRRRYGPGDLVRRHTGLQLTSPARTLVDLAQLLRPDALVCVLDHVLHRRVMSPAGLADLVVRRRWQPGVVALRAAVQLVDARAESPHETLTRLLLLPHLPGLVPQHRLRCADGRILARFDLADPRTRLAVESDGKAGHSGTRMAAKDQRRDRVSDRRGWRTERCTWFEVRCEQDALVRRMLEAAREQAVRHGVR
jgi:hypothetical protein